MSEFLEVETEFTEKDCLVFALEQVYGKGNVEVYREAQQLQGFKGDLRQQKAHIIIRKEHVGASSNDLGFEKVGDTYRMRISEFDKRQKRVPVTDITDLYSNKFVRNYARRNGYSVREIHQGKRIVLKLTR
jgi:hypothetical protein